MWIEKASPSTIIFWPSNNSPVVGDPYEHIAHFMAQCGNTSREDAWLLQQFVSSLSDAARTRYMHLEPESITSWNDMKKAFLNHFQYTAKKKGRARRSFQHDPKAQWDGWPVRLQMAKRSSVLPQSESVQMCMKGIHKHISKRLIAVVLKYTLGSS